MDQYQDYPMWMHHPAMRSATISDDPTLRQPMKFPPVLVHNEDQRLEHEARGYKMGGTPNPAAFRAQKVHRPTPAFVHHDYPKWVGDVLVQNVLEEARLLEAQPNAS